MVTSSDTSFDGLMERLRSGDQDAATRVFAEFSRRLAALARKRIQGALAAKVDPDDVLQSVFRSFFLRQRAGEFDIEGWDGMWSLLTIITLRKCGRQVAFFHSQRRNVRREFASAVGPEDSIGSCQAIAREPTPEESAMLIETLEDLLAQLTPRDRRVVERTLQGDDAEDISRDENCSERTVERIRAKLRERLEAMSEG